MTLPGNDLDHSTSIPVPPLMSITTPLTLFPNVTPPSPTIKPGILIFTHLSLGRSLSERPRMFINIGMKKILCVYWVK